jgi:predicted NUDIX family NTP pyrophosphohydrolase
MVIKKSAGLLVYKKAGKKLYVFLAHPGGPFWAKKDIGAWSIPKGEFDGSEDGLSAARREFTEEIGQTVEGRFIALTPCRQPSRKVVYAWAIEGEVDAARVQSNSFEMEWPPRSGRRQSFPEVDRGRWFAIDEAKTYLQPGQVPILEELIRRIETSDV